jgi:alcohol dehydrogenase class IV
VPGSAGQPLSAVFEPLPIERLYVGAGALASLGAELERLGVERALLLTGKTLSRGNLLSRVREAGGGRIRAEFAEVATHNPTSTVEAAHIAFVAANADAIVAFGGGSVVDCAKAVKHMLMPAGDDASRGIPLVDLATTLSGAEFACSFGQTDDETLVKMGSRALNLTANAIFLDPMLTAETPDWLWAATGMRAIDHAVETILAPNAIPYLDALASSAIEVFSKKLTLALTGDEEPRLLCLQAAWMAHAGSYFIQWGLSHQMGRQLGPRFAIPHGFTSAILLPAVVELERPAKMEQEACVARNLNTGSGGAANALRGLVRDLGLPSTLREAGISDRDAVEALFAGNQPALTVIDRSW